MVVVAACSSSFIVFQHMTFVNDWVKADPVSNLNRVSIYTGSKRFSVESGQCLYTNERKYKTLVRTRLHNFTLNL